MQNLSHWWYYSWSGWNTFMDIVALDGWWILPFVKYFCSLVQLHYSLLSSFIRKQQLAKYHPAVVLDFWSSLQTTLAQPKDFDRLLLTHLRQKDLILLTWIIGIFPFETWNCFRRLGIASRRLVGPTDWTKCRTVYRFLSSGKLKSSLSHQTWITFQFLECWSSTLTQLSSTQDFIAFKDLLLNRFLSCF